MVCNRYGALYRGSATDETYLNTRVHVASCRTGGLQGTVTKFVNGYAIASTDGDTYSVFNAALNPDAIVLFRGNSRSPSPGQENVLTCGVDGFRISKTALHVPPTGAQRTSASVFDNTSTGHDYGVPSYSAVDGNTVFMLGADAHGNAVDLKSGTLANSAA